MLTIIDSNVVQTGRSVLIVDDDPESGELAGLILSRAGYQVRQAHDGQEALTSLRTEGPADLVLLDLVMPGMDGRAVRDALGCDPVLAGIPIVLFSAMAERADMPGLAGYLHKPFEFNHLLAMVARVSRPAPVRISDAPSSATGERRPTLECRRRYRAVPVLAAFDSAVESVTVLLGALQDAPVVIQAACPPYLPSFEDFVVDLMVWAEQAERVMEASPSLRAVVQRRLAAAMKEPPR